MNVALAYNVKPESDTFTEILPPIRSDNITQPENVIETFAEWDTWETINALKEAIEVYHDINLIEADINAFEKLRQSRPDIVFNIAEGINNLSRESQIPAMLDMLNIPYTGSDALTSSSSVWQNFRGRLPKRLPKKMILAFTRKYYPMILWIWYPWAWSPIAVKL